LLCVSFVRFFLNFIHNGLKRVLKSLKFDFAKPAATLIMLVQSGFCTLVPVYPVDPAVNIVIQYGLFDHALNLAG